MADAADLESGRVHAAGRRHMPTGRLGQIGAAGKTPIKLFAPKEYTGPIRQALPI
ncbi:MAG: hypothetical protein KGY81_00940 [Phycisphaerae bacterium]|jgi:hypothetical protein|nr:hypothetical protein [Phycisphaerae bacterium]